MIETNVPRSWPEQRSRSFARERILRTLGATQRPLRWAELVDVLGGLTAEARMECEWLMDHGYIAPIQAPDQPDGEALWTFGERGLAWAEAHGETAPSQPAQDYAQEDLAAHASLASGRQGHRGGAAQEPG